MNLEHIPIAMSGSIFVKVETPLQLMLFPMGMLLIMMENGF